MSKSLKYNIERQVWEKVRQQVDFEPYEKKLKVWDKIPNQIWEKTSNIWLRILDTAMQKRVLLLDTAMQKRVLFQKQAK
jgi:hypothetical protein